MNMNKSITELRQLLDQKEVTSEELFQEAKEKALTSQEKLNAFVTILDDDSLNHLENKEHTILTGIPYALKDNISTANILTTASSNILKDYIPIYDATVYQKLKQAGALLVGKTTLDELAMGGTGTTAHTGIVKNPWDLTRQIGGSSAGSAAAVAAGIVPFAIGSDTGDSIRKPAAYGGIVGFKPTYGLISRYGLFAFASSLDHIGCFTRNVTDTAHVIDIIKGHDEKDMTSLLDDHKRYSETLTDEVKGKKLFYIQEICDIEKYDQIDDMLKETLMSFHENVKKLKEIGFEIEGVSFDWDLLKAIYPTYMTISCAEATSNNANLTGILYGQRAEGNSINEIMFQTRTLGFSELIKRRFILGSYILQKENQEKLFLNACRIRRLIVDKMNELFQTYDGLIMPTSGGIAPKFDEKTDQLSDEYVLESHLAIGNFGGFPSISLPSGFIHNLPISINLTGKVAEDDQVLKMAYHMEKTFGYQNQIAKEEKHV